MNNQLLNGGRDALNGIQGGDNPKYGNIMNRIAKRRNVVEPPIDNLDSNANRDDNPLQNFVKKNVAWERIFPGEDGLPWKDFETVGYIDVKRVAPGGDKYRRNKFNQEASDNMAVDRNVPDTRHDR